MSTDGYAFVLANPADSKKQNPGWVVAMRTADVIDHVPLKSRDLDEAVAEAVEKYPELVIVCPRRGDPVPS